MASIRCQDCGTERHRVPSNTRYCKRCRILRDIAHWVHNRRRCRECRASFAPLNAGDHRCSVCHPGTPGTSVDCVLCGQPGRVLVPGMPVCDRCMRAPAKRTALYDALRKGQRLAQKERNDATT